MDNSQLPRGMGRRQWCSARRAGSLVVSCVITASVVFQSHAGGIPNVDIQWQIGADPPDSTSVSGIPSGNGAIYLGSHIDSGSQWLLQWTLFADGNLDDDAASVTNSITFSSSALNPLDVTITVSVPVNQSLAASLIAGQVSFELTADNTTAQLSSIAPDAVWSGLIETVIVEQQFIHPTQTNSPPFSSTTSTNHTFGIPVPLTGPAVNATFGYTLRFELSPGDTVTFFGEFTINAPAPIPGDTNNDGMVDVTDLLTVLGGWGACPIPCPPTCAADTNGDCAVDVTDLLTVLGNWG